MVGGDDRINRRISIAKTVGRLVLSDPGNFDGYIIIRVCHTDDVHRKQLVIRCPEYRHIGMRVTDIWRVIDVIDCNRYRVESPATEVDPNQQLVCQLRTSGVYEGRRERWGCRIRSGQSNRRPTDLRPCEVDWIIIRIAT